MDYLGEVPDLGHGLDFGFDATVRDFPAIHEDLCPLLSPPTVTRFPSLSRSLHGSVQSESTLAENHGQEHSEKDVEENARQAPSPVGFFDAALNEIRLVILIKYSWTRK